MNNFVSGLIPLVERPIHGGDTVEVADLTGEVSRIGIRASTVHTWGGSAGARAGWDEAAGDVGRGGPDSRGT